MEVVGNYVKRKNVFKFKFYPCRIRLSEKLLFVHKTPTGTGKKIKHLLTQRTRNKIVVLVLFKTYLFVLHKL